MRHLDYLWLILAEAVFSAGKAALLLVFAKLFYDLTGEIWASAITYIGDKFIAFFLPIIISKYLEVTRARSLVIGSAKWSVLLAGITTAAMHSLETPLLFLLLMSIGLSALALISRMAIFAVTPEVVSEKYLTQFNARVAFSIQLGQLLGIGLAGILLTTSSATLGFLVVTALYSVAWCLYRRALKYSAPTSPSRDKDRPPFANMVDMLLRNPNFLCVVILSNFDIVAVSIFNLLLPAIVAVHYQGDPRWLMLLDGSFAAGALLGSILLSLRSRSYPARFSMAVAAQITFVFFLFLWLVPGGHNAAIVTLVVFGFFQVRASVYWRSYLQGHIDIERLGALTSMRFFASSVQIAIASAALSIAHTWTFEMSIFISLLLTGMQLVFLFVFFRWSRIEMVRKV